MFDDLFSKTYYGNTIGQWLLAGGLILLSLVAGRILYWFFKKIITALTKKTNTKIDDIILDMVEEPLSFAIVLASVWYSLHYALQMNNGSNVWLNKIYYVLVIFNTTWLLTRLFAALMNEYIRPIVEKSEGHLDDQLFPIFRQGINIAIWVIAIMVAADNAGYDLKAILASLGLGGLAFALAAKETAASFIASLTIVIDRPFMLNQWINVNGVRGRVESVGLRSTCIRSEKGSLVIMPNAEVINHTIENYSMGPGIIEEIDIPLSYQTTEEELEKAIRILKEMPQHITNIAAHTSVSLNAFSEIGINIRYRYFTLTDKSTSETRTMVTFAIYKNFRAHNIKLVPTTRTELLGDSLTVMRELNHETFG